MLHDARYALRMFYKNAGFTAIALLALALGIGANTAIFSLTNQVLIRPLPFPQSDQLVRVWESYGAAGSMAPVSYPDFHDWREWSHCFSDLAAYSTISSVMTGAGEPVHLQGVIASANLFRLLGAQPSLGRAFLDEEDRPHANGGADSIILSQQLWRERFGGDASILGRNLVLDGAPYTVVGVMPAGFDSHSGLNRPDYWITAAAFAETASTASQPWTEQRDRSFLSVIGRLKAGVTLAQAQADMDRVSQRLAETYRKELNRAGATIRELQSFENGDVQPILLVLLAATGVVLLIACADVGGLVLVRLTRRQREITVRAALGAGKWRLLRQLLVESLVLALLGGALGLWIAATAAQPLGRILGLESFVLSIDARVLAFCLGISLVAAIVFSLAPMLHAAKADLMKGLKEAALSAGESRRQKRIQSAMLIAQMALSMVLLTASGLFGLSLIRLQQRTLGFDAERVLTFPVSLALTRHPQSTRATLFEDLRNRLSAIPGVEAVSAGGRVPFRGGVSRTVLDNVAGRDIPMQERRGIAFSSILPGYFRSLGVRVERGREFEPRDSATAEPVVIINRAAARQYFGDRDPIGQQIQPLMWNGSGSTTRPRTIVGVVADVKSQNVLERGIPSIYWPSAQIPSDGTMYMTLRVSGDPNAILRPAASQVHALDPDLPFYGAHPLSFFVGETLSQPRRNTVLVGLFAGLALVLSVVGLYGVVSFSVVRQTREIGIRMALGANRREVLRMFLRQALVVCVAGVGLGLPAAIAAARWMRSLLTGLSSPDPWIFAAAGVALIGAALLASLVPARRATKLDPMIALRWE